MFSKSVKYVKLNIYITFKKYICGVTAPINRIYPLWGASPSRFIGSSPSVGRTNQGLDLVVVIASPTSARVPSHIWFISFWSDHMCTTPTRGKSRINYCSIERTQPKGIHLIPDQIPRI